MNRFVKLSRLLKLSAENDSAAWSAVIAEVESEALPDYPELAMLGESIEKAKELKSQTEEVAGTVSTFTQEDYDGLRNLAQNGEAFDSMLARLQKTSGSKNSISKRAGIWSSVKSMFSVGARVLPFIGVIASAYFLMENWKAIEAAKATIKQNFKEFESNGQDLFHPKTIAALINQHSADPVKMLSLAKLNKVAKFYQVNVLEWWFNAVMGVVDIINSVVVLATWGGAAAIEALLASIAGVAGYAGMAAGAGMISVSFFDGLVGDFVSNTNTIKSIAGQKASQISDGTIQEPEMAEETYEG